MTPLGGLCHGMQLGQALHCHQALPTLLVPLVSAKLYSSMFGQMAICSTYWPAYLISDLIANKMKYYE